MTYEEHLAKLVKASKRLSPDHKAQGRNNSRAAVLEALRQCRMALDADYPCHRKKPSRKKSPEARIADLQCRGYILLVACHNPTHVREVADSVKVAVHKVTARNGVATYWVPRWLNEACLANLKFEEIRRLARSPNAREVFMTQVRLQYAARGQ